MANVSTQLALNKPWMKASELYVLHEESKHAPLCLNQLSAFFLQGLRRGSIVEITGPKSSGKTSTSLYILAESIRNGETCAYIDLFNQFSPVTFAHLGVTLDLLSWVRCTGNTEHAFRSADLLLHAGGFGVVLLDLSGASAQTLNRIPLSYWFRFQRAIEDTSTILLVCCEQQQARSCSRYSLSVQTAHIRWRGKEPFARLDGVELTARMNKPAQTKVVRIRPEPLWIPTPVISSRALPDTGQKA